MLLWRHVEQEDQSDVFPASHVWDGTTASGDSPAAHPLDVHAIAVAIAEAIGQRAQGREHGNTDLVTTKAKRESGPLNDEDLIPF
jgi:hypothetical protein